MHIDFIAVVAVLASFAIVVPFAYSLPSSRVLLKRDSLTLVKALESSITNLGRQRRFFQKIRDTCPLDNEICTSLEEHLARIEKTQEIMQNAKADPSNRILHAAAMDGLKDTWEHSRELNKLLSPTPAPVPDPGILAAIKNRWNHLTLSGKATVVGAGAAVAGITVTGVGIHHKLHNRDVGETGAEPGEPAAQAADTQATGGNHLTASSPGGANGVIKQEPDLGATG